MENDNKRLHQWFGFCWHEPKRLTNEEREPIRGFFGTIRGFKHPTLTATCVKCGDPINPININGVDTCYPRPRYDTESGFFALLDGLKAKKLRVSLIQLGNGVCEAYIQRTNGSQVQMWDALDKTLNLALHCAAIAAMDAETK